MITKEMFAKCIRSLKRVNDFQNGVCELVREINRKNEDREYSDLGAMLYPDSSDALTELLVSVMNDTEGYIYSFCWGYDFGREAKDDFPATIDELWNVLIKKEELLSNEKHCQK